MTKSIPNWPIIRSKFHSTHYSLSQNLHLHWRKALKKLITKTLKYLHQNLHFLSNSIRFPLPQIQNWLQKDIADPQLEQSCQKWVLKQSSQLSTQQFYSWIITFLQSNRIKSMQNHLQNK